MRQIDPALAEEVTRFLDDPRSLSALVTVGSEKLPGPVNLAEAVELLTLQATNICRVKPTRVVLFVRLNAFAVEAPARFLEALLRQDLVKGATLNEG